MLFLSAVPHLILPLLRVQGCKRGKNCLLKAEKQHGPRASNLPGKYVLLVSLALAHRARLPVPRQEWPFPVYSPQTSILPFLLPQHLGQDENVGLLIDNRNSKRIQKSKSFYFTSIVQPYPCWFYLTACCQYMYTRCAHRINLTVIITVHAV